MLDPLKPKVKDSVLASSIFKRVEKFPKTRTDKCPLIVAKDKITKHHRLCGGTFLKLALSLNLDKLNLKITNCKKAQNFFVVSKKASSLNHNLKDED